MREAYRMLQSYSHIRLPRVNSEEMSNSSPLNVSESDKLARITESRLEMHLAAAGIRVWASIIGRGMLSLGILMGSRIPTQLRVPPICLRGRAISSTTGRHVFVDLAREFLSSANNDANRVGTNDPPVSTMEMNGVSGDRRTAIPSSQNNTFTEYPDASNHPGNSLALAIASAVSFSGAGSSLRVSL